jgi:hypothetical protein
MASLTPSPKLQLFTANGTPLVGGKLYTYAAGTTSPLATYTDSSGTSANPNPIILDSRGEASVWLDATSYKLRLLSDTDVEIWTVDNIAGAGLANQQLVNEIAATYAASNGSSLVGYLPAGTGAVATTVQTKLRETVSVKDFGASPSATATANTTAIQAAADYCETNGYFLQGVPGTYSTNATIVLKCDGDLSSMTLNVDATAVSTAVRVGPNTAGQYLFDIDLKLPFVNNTAKTGAGWVGFDTSIGVEIANVYQSRISVPSVYNFGVGLKEGGYGVGCVYNTITIGVLFGNKINHQLKPGDAAGWANQNTHIGGRFGYSSSEGTVVAGVKHIETRDYDGTGPGAPNNNTWLTPSVEGNEPEFHLDIQGSFNNFINPRLEVGTGIPARVNFHAITANETVSNNLIGGYDISGTTYTFSGAGTSTRNKRIGGSFNDSYEFSGNGINLVNKSGSSRTAPHIQGFLSSATALGKDNASTDWIYRLHGDGWSSKSSGDSFDRVQINAAGYLYFGRGTGAPTAGFRAGSAGEVQAQSILQPETDNVTTLGAAAKRWSVVYAGTGTINTSDAREKQQIRSLSAAENAVAVRLKSLIKAFKFNDAAQAKGDNARIHVGVIAQEVIAAFEVEGLDASRYAIVCYDEWDAELDEEGNEVRPAGNRYGVRYEELLAFIISAL